MALNLTFCYPARFVLDFVFLSNFAGVRKVENFFEENSQNFLNPLES